MLTSVGIGTEASLGSHQDAARTELRRSPRLIATDFNCRIAGEVKGFDPAHLHREKRNQEDGALHPVRHRGERIRVPGLGLQGHQQRGSRAHRRVYRQRHRRIRSDRARTQDSARKRAVAHLAVFYSGDHHQSRVGLCFDPHRREGSEFGHGDGLHHQRAFDRRFFPPDSVRRCRRDDLRRHGGRHHADGHRRIRGHARAVAAQ